MKRGDGEKPMEFVAEQVLPLEINRAHIKQPVHATVREQVVVAIARPRSGLQVG